MDSVNWQEIRQLLSALDESSVVELTLESDTFRLSLRKASVPTVEVMPSPAAMVATPAPSPPVAAPAPAAPVASPPQAAEPPTHWVDIVAPMVGTFYTAPAPGEADFVKLGDRVQKGQTLCIVEAMKLMNEIEAEVDGRIAEILVVNAKPIEFGQVLMRIDPS